MFSSLFPAVVTSGLLNSCVWFFSLSKECFEWIFSFLNFLFYSAIECNAILATIKSKICLSKCPCFAFHFLCISVVKTEGIWSWFHQFCSFLCMFFIYIWRKNSCANVELLSCSCNGMTECLTHGGDSLPVQGTHSAEDNLQWWVGP